VSVLYAAEDSHGLSADPDDLWTQYTTGVKEKKRTAPALASPWPSRTSTAAGSLSASGPDGDLPRSGRGLPFGSGHHGIYNTTLTCFAALLFHAQQESRLGNILAGLLFSRAQTILAR
jgi:hypothetical protein